MAANLSQGSQGKDIWSAPRLATIPTVAVSASDTDIALPKAKETGFDSYISKPIDRILFPQKLLTTLNGEAVWHGKQTPYWRDDILCLTRSMP